MRPRRVAVRRAHGGGRVTGARQGGHAVEWGHFGWACSCGAGREWPLAPESRAKAAAMAHLRAVNRRSA